VVPVHNEAGVIAAKIENLAALDYPEDRLAVAIVLDGCTDGTEAAAAAALQRIGSPGTIRIEAIRQNRGKVAVLNDRISAARTDIVILTDASNLVEPNALLCIAAHFANPAIGVVAGRYEPWPQAGNGERAYWAHQTRVKAREAALAAPMGVHGAFYAIRKSAFEPLPLDTINDDFLLPMAIVAKGYRAIYDWNLVVRELEPSRTGHEFRRRVRIGAGNLQQVLRLWPLADPRRGWLAFIFVSGKGLRAFLPAVLALLFTATAVLALSSADPVFAALFGAQISALTIAAIGSIGGSTILPPPLSWIAYAVNAYVAGAVGSIALVTGLGGGVWRFSAAGKAAGHRPLTVPRAAPNRRQRDPPDPRR
jgi:cellulose synthase/poly-beta-1,6-N-acetylglucosamine synthase-like glycosyltransferase